MAAHEGPISTTSAASSELLQKLTLILPKGISFKIYHLSTPPSRTSAIYSAPPTARPDRTYCESHFLAVSIQTRSADDGAEPVDVLVYAIEILIYSTAYDTTLFVSKADSTGYLHLLDLPRGTPSPIRAISVAFLKHLLERHQRPNIQSVVSLFARAQDQYLFPGSIEYSGKHVLDDRGLVRWWCRVLDPLIQQPEVSTRGMKHWDKVLGYLIIPGLDSHETRSYVPRSTASGTQWTIGHPLQEISHHPGDVPPRCLIPHFPDDPKARFLDELDDEITKGEGRMNGRWKSVKTIDQFWDMMAFRQECSAGRMVGFIWIVFKPYKAQSANEGIGDSQSTVVTDDQSSLPRSQNSNFLPVTPATSFTTSSQTHPQDPTTMSTEDVILFTSQQTIANPTPCMTAKKKKPKLTGPIIPREPRIKTQNKNYLIDIPETTAYYHWVSSGRGQVIVDESDYKRITELLLRLDFANLELTTSSTRRWVNEVRSGASGSMGEAWGQTVTGTSIFESPSATSATGVNTLSVGLVKKKRKGLEDPTNSKSAESVRETAPAVNVLGASMIRKKAKV
ncbi:histone acetylation protein-domain-containing protein [Tricladium varicosporioides]|nr:histone acetylation protein-domain-containing protein [Hymenoscyphus varicosporioides]